MFDLTGRIIAYEAGELDEGEEIELFQELVNTGLAWQLRGAYGRRAARWIDEGVITRPEGRQTS